MTVSISARLFRVLTLGVAVVASTVFIASTAASATVTATGPTTGGTPVTIDGITFTQVAGGNNAGYGLTSEGTVYSWGYGTDGRLGNGDTVHSSTPVQVVGVGGVDVLTEIVEVSAGRGFALALANDGSVYAWGYGADGRLGNGNTASSSTPVQVLGVGGVGALSDIVQVAAGYYSSYALASDGTVYAWGFGLNGRLGNGGTADSSTPVQVVGVGGTGVLADVTEIAMGGNFGYALTTGGAVYSWGYGAYGALGNGGYADSSTPVQVSGLGGSGVLTGVSQVGSGGGYTGYVLTNSGTVYAWGEGDDGQLGNGGTANSSTPVQVVGVGGAGVLSGIAQVSSASDVAYALADNGTVYAWGYGLYGALGNGGTGNSSTPVQVVGVGGSGVLSGITQIHAGNQTAYALDSAATTIYVWGDGYYGGLGTGSTASSSTPVAGANFQPASISFGNALGTGFSATGNSWSAVSPAGDEGTVGIIGTANLFGGSTPASTPTLSWIAGTFTYVASGGTGGNGGNSGSGDGVGGGLLTQTGAPASTFTLAAVAALLLALGVGLGLIPGRRASGQ